MIEIKFRAWNKKTKRWKFGELTKLGFFVSYELLPGDVNMGGSAFFDGCDDSSDLSEWMQYTGLRDKNGKEIYKGDILKMDKGTDEETNCEVCWLDGSLVLVGDRYNAEPIGAQIRSYEGKRGLFGEIIGNISNNPELLN